MREERERGEKRESVEKRRMTFHELISFPFQFSSLCPFMPIIPSNDLYCFLTSLSTHFPSFHSVNLSLSLSFRTHFLSPFSRSHFKAHLTFCCSPSFSIFSIHWIIHSVHFLFTPNFMIRKSFLSSLSLPFSLSSLSPPFSLSSLSLSLCLSKFSLFLLFCIHTHSHTKPSIHFSDHQMPQFYCLIVSLTIHDKRFNEREKRMKKGEGEKGRRRKRERERGRELGGKGRKRISYWIVIYTYSFFART